MTTQQAKEIVDTLMPASNVSTVSVGGLTYFGVTFNDWVLLLTALLLVLNVLWVGSKLFDRFILPRFNKRGRDGSEAANDN